MMKNILVGSGLVLSIFSQSILPAWGESILKGKIQQGTEDLLSRQYGGGMFAHPWPLIQRWEEGQIYNNFEKDCAKYKDAGIGQKATEDCVECRKLEQKMGLDEKSFSQIRAHLADSAQYEGAKALKGDPQTDQMLFRQWLWLNRAVKLQKDGMERTLPVLYDVKNTLKAVNASGGQSKVLDDPKHGVGAQYIKAAEQNISELAIIEAELESKRITLNEDEKQTRIQKRRELLRKTPTVAHEKIYKWIQDAAQEYDDNTIAGKATVSKERIQTYVKNNFLKIRLTLGEAVKDHINLLVTNKPKLAQFMEDGKKLQDTYNREKKSGDLRVKTKEELNQFIGGALYAAPLLRLTSHTDPSAIPGLEQAGCQIKKRAEKLELQSDMTMLTYSLVGGGLGAKAATSALPMAFPELSAAATRMSALAANIPPAYIDFGANLKAIAERCKNLSSQIASGASGLSKDDEGDLQKEYNDCVGMESDFQKFASAGYGVGAVAALFAKSAVKLSGPAVKKMLGKSPAAKALGPEDLKEVNKVAAAELERSQLGAAKAAEEAFKKEMESLRVTLMKKHNGDESKVIREMEKIQTERTALAMSDDQKAFSKRLDGALDACSPGAKKTGWAEEIGLPWLTSSIGRSTQRDPLHELFLASL